MSSDFGPWERVASELRACRQAQQQAWGDLDNATLGRYLAGDVTPDERRRIEAELERRPELRKLTDLVSDVLREEEPAARPAVLPFRSAANAARRWRQQAAVALAACLLLALGYTVLPTGGPSPTANLFFRKTTAMRPVLAPGDWDAKHELVLAEGDNRNAPAKPATPLLEPVVLTCADGLCYLGDTYQKHGDLDMAEFTYKLAYNIQEWKLGPDAAPTAETRRNLGQVYETALALADDTPAAKVMAPSAFPAPAAPPILGAVKPDAQLRNNALQLRDRLCRQPVEQVRKSVVPILVDNLNKAKTPEDRERFGLALANLGAAAKEAAPALDATLAKAETPREREVVRDAKRRLEKAAENVGIHDAAGLLSLAAVNQAEKEIAELARTAQVEIVAETRPATRGVADGADKDGAPAVGAKGVAFVFRPAPGGVEVYVGDAMRAEGFDDARKADLERVVAAPVKNGDFDGALLAGVRFVAQFEAETAKP